MHGEDYWGDHDAFRPERFIDRETGAFRYGITKVEFQWHCFDNRTRSLFGGCETTDE